MTRLWATNANNDIFATADGQLAQVTGNAAVAQYSRHVVEASRGEMRYARSRGVDYLNNIFDGTPNVLLFEAQVRAAIGRIPQVASITTFDTTVADNRLTYTLTLQLDNGATETVNGSL